MKPHLNHRHSPFLRAILTLKQPQIIDTHSFRGSQRRFLGQELWVSMNFNEFRVDFDVNARLKLWISMICMICVLMQYS